MLWRPRGKEEGRKTHDQTTQTSITCKLCNDNPIRHAYIYSVVKKVRSTQPYILIGSIGGQIASGTDSNHVSGSCCPCTSEYSRSVTLKVPESGAAPRGELNAIGEARVALNRYSDALTSQISICKDQNGIA